MIILILVLILILVVFYFKTNVNWYSLWKNAFNPFPLKQFFRECGDNSVLLGEYSDSGKPSLMLNKQIQIKLKDWLENNEIFNGNRQSKLIFFENSESPIANFIKNWVKKNKNSLPEQFRYRDIDEYTIRISRNKWQYPSHFDAVDNFMFVVSGNRNVKLNKTIDSKPITLKLNKNDILFLKNGTYHHFWCDNTNKLNIIINILFKPEDNDTQNKFIDTYPIRIEEIKAGLEYI